MFYYGKIQCGLGLSSEMLGSARPEKDVILTGEFDWRYFFSDGTLPGMCPSL